MQKTEVIHHLLKYAVEDAWQVQGDSAHWPPAMVRLEFSAEHMKLTAQSDTVEMTRKVPVVTNEIRGRFDVPLAKLEAVIRTCGYCKGTGSSEVDHGVVAFTHHEKVANLLHVSIIDPDGPIDTVMGKLALRANTAHQMKELRPEALFPDDNLILRSCGLAGALTVANKAAGEGRRWGNVFLSVESDRLSVVATDNGRFVQTSTRIEDGPHPYPERLLKGIAISKNAAKVVAMAAHRSGAQTSIRIGTDIIFSTREGSVRTDLVDAKCPNYERLLRPPDHVATCKKDRLIHAVRACSGSGRDMGGAAVSECTVELRFEKNAIMVLSWPTKGDTAIVECLYDGPDKEILFDPDLLADTMGMAAGSAISLGVPGEEHEPLRIVGGLADIFLISPMVV